MLRVVSNHSITVCPEKKPIICWTTTNLFSSFTSCSSVVLKKLQTQGNCKATISETVKLLQRLNKYNFNIEAWPGSPCAYHSVPSTDATCSIYCSITTVFNINTSKHLIEIVIKVICANVFLFMCGPILLVLSSRTTPSLSNNLHCGEYKWNCHCQSKHSSP